MPKKKSADLGLGNPIKFYDDEITLRFSERDHAYYLEKPDGTLELQNGVTQTCHIIDHSVYLIPWAVKMSADKLIKTMPKHTDELGIASVLPIGWDEFEELVKDAKRAHKETLTDAGDVGTAAHTWIEDSIRYAIENTKGVVKKMDDRTPSDERVVNCGLAAFDWMKQHETVWLKTEHKVYSRKFSYAGTMDGLAKIDGVLSVADWKTSNYLRTEFLLQTAAYQMAEIEEFGTPVEDRWILRLGKEDGQFEPWHCGPSTTEQDFEAFRLCLMLARAHRVIEKRMADDKKHKKRSAA